VVVVAAVCERRAKIQDLQAADNKQHKNRNCNIDDAQAAKQALGVVLLDPRRRSWVGAASGVSVQIRGATPTHHRAPEADAYLPFPSLRPALREHSEAANMRRSCSQRRSMFRCPFAPGRHHP
jgi:hypothetical protein